MGTKNVNNILIITNDENISSLIKPAFFAMAIITKSIPPFELSPIPVRTESLKDSLYLCSESSDPKNFPPNARIAKNIPKTIL